MPKPPVDPRLKRGDSPRERRVPEELEIYRLIPAGREPAALYDVGVGCYNEFRTLKIVWPNLNVYGCEPNPAEHADLPRFSPARWRRWQ